MDKYQVKNILCWAPNVEASQISLFGKFDLNVSEFHY